MHECPTCGRDFETRRGLGVHHVHTHGERLPNRTCAACGTEFFENYARKYCSEECYRDAVSYAGEENPNYSGAKERAECAICGTEFEYYPTDKKGLYCGECVEGQQWRYRPEQPTGEDSKWWKGGKIEKECEWCGETIRRRPGEFRGKVALCDRLCQQEWLSEAFSGDGHPNWKGGGSEEYGNGWRRTRLAALDRDDHTCQICGLTKDEIGRNPDVHHIRPVRAFIESEEHEKIDAHTLDNVITLCVTCHRRADFGIIPAERLRAMVEAA